MKMIKKTMNAQSLRPIVRLCLIVVATISFLVQPSSSFVVPLHQKCVVKSSTKQQFSVSSPFSPVYTSPAQQQRGVRLFSMPPQLPPSGGGSNSNSEWKSIGMSVLSIAGVFAFFASPLGGIVFALFNSLLLLVVLLPLIGIVAFQVWQATSTIEGACPSCGAPARVPKNDASALESTPGLCLNCGSILQATLDNSRIELVGPLGGGAVNEEAPAAAFWDSLFAGATGSNSPASTPVRSTSSTTTTTSSTSKGDQYRRERTVIDVEVEED
jgi:hypothetical protein